MQMPFVCLPSLITLSLDANMSLFKHIDGISGALYYDLDIKINYNLKVISKLKNTWLYLVIGHYKLKFC